MKFCIVGAGFSGAVIGRHLAKNGHDILLIDERNHIGGNSHTSRDKKTNIMIHHYGPHIFHTSHKHVWDFVNHFGKFQPYINRVKAISQNHVYTLPVNLLTINQFYGKTFNPAQAEEFITHIADKSIKEPANFEEQALSMIGPDLYNAFFKGYTKKQWGIDPRKLPASILKRLPVRFNYNDNYFNHAYQGIPEDGYTKIIQNIINIPNLKVELNTKFEDINKDEFDHIFYTGPIDRYFNFSEGRLPYRTLDFKRYEGSGDHQGTAVINYCDETIPFTRISEHKHFAPWEDDHLKDTIWFEEYSRLANAKDIPYYPIRLTTEMTLLDKYIKLAKNAKKVSFLGRLGTYRYLDMDVTIFEALEACKIIDQKLKEGALIPSLFNH